MMKRSIADEIAAGIGDALARLGSVKEDVDKQIRAVIANALDKLDIVTRDEYEVQQALVNRLASQVDALEQRLSALEVKQAVDDEPAED